MGDLFKDTLFEGQIPGLDLVGLLVTMAGKPTSGQRSDRYNVLAQSVIFTTI